jgi:hypothetical protein
LLATNVSKNPKIDMKKANNILTRTNTIAEENVAQISFFHPTNLTCTINIVGFDQNRVYRSKIQKRILLDKRVKQQNTKRINTHKES